MRDAEVQICVACPAREHPLRRDWLRVGQPSFVGDDVEAVRRAAGAMTGGTHLFWALYGLVGEGDIVALGVTNRAGFDQRDRFFLPDPACGSVLLGQIKEAMAEMIARDRYATGG